ncbi:ABC transporter substrate-binding protein, partial [Candidatus Bipolaricaulota bacterium]|nr:ABC transporter substrate-binding protein [Candidatus Bipolaricaulota bacterium]
MRRINMAATLIVFSLLASVIFGELPMTAAELEHITIQFRWYHQFQFAGYYAAVEQGFFSAEGLDVSLRERSWESSPVQDVLAGHAEYGVSDATLLIDRVRG